MWNADRPSPESLFTSPEWNSEETLIEAGAAGHQRGEVNFTDRWRRLRAPGKAIHAESKRGPAPAVRSGAATESDRPQLFHRSSDRSSLFREAAAAGLSWPLPDDLDDRGLEELLFPAAVGRPSKTTRSLPDFAEIRRQLQAHKHLTLQLVWEEYRETQPGGYGYSRFCELYDRWSR